MFRSLSRVAMSLLAATWLGTSTHTPRDLQLDHGGIIRGDVT